MREDGILIQPNATYFPKLVAMMKVSGRRKKGLPYHATPETFNAEFVVESEMLDGEQGGLFRSGLGLTLYMAMDRPDIQFVVKVLSSYMSRPSVKAISALKHLASYLEGTPDDGILHVQLKKQRWSVTCGKGMTHLSRMKLQFQIGRQMEDSF